VINNLVISKCEDNSGNFVVICDGWSTGSLTRDETLGVVAHKLYLDTLHCFFKHKIPTKSFPKKDDLVYFDSCGQTYLRYATGNADSSGNIEVYNNGATSQTATGTYMIYANNWRLAE
jgi:hypothetical protein